MNVECVFNVAVMPGKEYAWLGGKETVVFPLATAPPIATGTGTLSELLIYSDFRLKFT
ncbi:hypothetical protein ACPJXG_05520 [Janthinobacterium sp. NFX145]|uniref:hypothetical protein n=1 Tax=Janthinobacterium sp. NFX145 TaxID=3415602 RepID=UPI003CC60F7D